MWASSTANQIRHMTEYPENDQNCVFIDCFWAVLMHYPSIRFRWHNQQKFTLNFSAILIYKNTTNITQEHTVVHSNRGFSVFPRLFFLFLSSSKRFNCMRQKNANGWAVILLLVQGKMCKENEKQTVQLQITEQTVCNAPVRTMEMGSTEFGCAASGESESVCVRMLFGASTNGSASLSE